VRLTFLLLLLTLTANAQRIRRLDGSWISTAEADSFARATLDQHRVTGAQLAVIDRGRLVWSAAYGLRRRTPDLPMTTSTNIWAASITKSVFATYVMQLVERRQLALDKPVVQLLPKPLPDYPAYAKTGLAIVNDPRWAQVTPRMLLSHTSGLLNFAFLEPDGQMRLHQTPGREYRYSGEGLNLLQFVIEQQQGRPLDQLMQDALFTPLGMTRSGLIFRKEFAENVADRFDAAGQFRAETRRFPARGAGSMATTVEDLTRFAIALTNGKLLKKSTRREMLKPQIPIRTLHQFALAANEPPGQEAQATGLAYGLGWGLLTKTRFGPAFFKEGHGDGAQTYMICFERRRACMILLTNSDNGELAFRPLMEKILGNTVTPWEWEGYTPAYIEQSRRQGN